PAAYKVIDFGIAVPDARPRARVPPKATPSLRLEPDGWVGKRGYVDPVCVVGDELPTSQSDLYALGALLFVCLTGKIPAAATGSLDEQVLAGERPPPPLSDLQPDAPPDLVDLVAGLLSPEREVRPGSAELVVIVLERLRGSFSGRTRALPPEDDGPFRG